MKRVFVFQSTGPGLNYFTFRLFKTTNFNILTGILCEQPTKICTIKWSSIFLETLIPNFNSNFELCCLWKSFLPFILELNMMQHLHNPDRFIYKAEASFWRNDGIQIKATLFSARVLKREVFLKKWSWTEDFKTILSIEVLQKLLWKKTCQGEERWFLRVFPTAV